MSDNSFDALNLIPWPRSIRKLDGELLLSSIRAISIDVEADTARGAAELLAAHLKLSITKINGNEIAVRFTAPSSLLAPEAYWLKIGTDGISLSASTAVGYFYGVQTLLQIIGSESALPALEIEDEPRFRWRGLMLDVSRHLMPGDGILRLLDCMAIHKLNSFHWHLTDDQGWRVESKRFPKLTEIGAYRRGADGELTFGLAEKELPHLGTYGGFYTLEDIRRVVNHATKLQINVVPEIEMPGHATAALAAYPYLACTDGPFETAVRTGIFKNVYCAGNDQTIAFLETVLEEVLPLFPGEYVHVGGDECLKDNWKTCPKCQARIRNEGLKDEHELQSWVIQRMSRFLAQRGKKLIGWDEILEGGLAPGATVMSWRGMKGGIEAAKAGRDVVMSPRNPCYLDYRQAADGEPKAIGEAVNSLEMAYAFNPIPTELSADQAKHVLGLQGNVWTEYMPNMRHVEYMIWPRAAALAEVAWTPAEQRNWESFSRRVKVNEKRLADLGSNYRPVAPAAV